jgi:galactosylceramidase
MKRLLLLGLLSPAVLGAQTVTLDATRGGRVFEGIGALSAGASSRLLIDYPEPQRSEVLDLLFKPGHGASLQHLKVEIGGDVNSTCGTEPAFAHTREEFLAADPAHFKRGYEGWLMVEARKRNPQIRLDALQWGAPAWIGDGRFYSQDNADFIAAFHRRCQQELGLETHYQGIWNETKWDPAWIKTLRRTLDQAGAGHVLIGAADQSDADAKWAIVAEAAQDPELDRAIHAFGDHYLGYQSTEAARQTGKPLWANEDGPWLGDWYGATKIAKLLNRCYIEGRITRVITWSLVTGYYDLLPLPRSGLMTANEPWSGHYRVDPAIWVVAHTTQFTAPGWRYVDSGCGHLEAPGGSYVTLRSPDGGDFSVIVETMDSAHAYAGLARGCDVTFELGAGFPSKPVHVWRSTFQKQFEKIATVEPKDGRLAYHFDNEALYTLSTTTGQQKGDAAVTPPDSTALPLPYRDGFDVRPEHALPRYFMDQAGVFEVVDRPGGRGGCLRQVVPRLGIEWRHHKNPEPFTILGDARWQDYAVEVETRIEGEGHATVIGRTESIQQSDAPPLGYWLKVGHEGAWTLHRHKDALAQGKVRFTPGRWHWLGLKFEGDRITALVDRKVVARVTDATYRRGLAGFGCGWQRSWFDNFSVRPVGRKTR